MKKTVFNEIHRQKGGKMVSFAGYEMPVEFSGITQEHMAIRNSVGVFDVSHMGEFWIKGEKSLDFIQKITSNDASVLQIGKAQYSCFPNGKGGIVDDLLVYKYSEDKFMLVVNAANIEKDWNWCVLQNIEGVELENASDQISQLAIQGPNAIKVLQKLTDINLNDIPYYSFVTGVIGGVDDVIISNTGYTGAGGFELYIYNENAITVYNEIMKAGEEFDIIPVGLGARDTLRLEKGYCLYGNDIDESTSPIEAGLGWITKFSANKNFIDKEILLAQKSSGVTKSLKGFVMKERGIPRHDYEIVNAQDQVIGIVTSGTQSPVLNCGIGLGYIDSAYSSLGQEIFIKIRNRKLSAEVVRLPFV